MVVIVSPITGREVVLVCPLCDGTMIAPGTEDPRPKARELAEAVHTRIVSRWDALRKAQEAARKAAKPREVTLKKLQVFCRVLQESRKRDALSLLTATPEETKSWEMRAAVQALYESEQSFIPPEDTRPLLRAYLKAADNLSVPCPLEEIRELPDEPPPPTY